MSSEYQRQWRAARKAKGLSCHTPQRLAKQAEWLAETYRKLRTDLFDIVGHVCMGCGHDDCHVLEFDHIHDDGAEDRLRFKGARSMLDYYVKRPAEARERLQALCRNCNWLKRKGHPLPGRLLDGVLHDARPLVAGLAPA